MILINVAILVVRIRPISVDKCADRRVGNLSRVGYLGQDVRVSDLEATEHLLHIIDNSGI